MRVTLQGSGVVSLLQVSMDNFAELEEVGHIGSKDANNDVNIIETMTAFELSLEVSCFTARFVNKRFSLKPFLQPRLDLTLTSEILVDTKPCPKFLADSLILLLFNQETRSGEKQAAVDFQARRSSVQFGIVDSQTGTIWNFLSCT